MTSSKPKNPRRSPRQERAHATVEALLTATAQILVKEGYARASTNRIAKRAGVSIGSLYQYFPNKDALVNELLEQLVDQQFGRLATTLAQSLNQDASLEQTISMVLRAMVHSQQMDLTLTRILFEQIPRTGQFELARLWHSRATDTLAIALETRRHQLRPQNLQLTAYILVQTYTGVFNTAVLSRPDLLQDDSLLEEMEDMLLRYLRLPPKP